jgi:hypothetical protein
MKTSFILCCMVAVAFAPACFAQASPSKPAKWPKKETRIENLEKSAWEAYKNKQTDAFKRLLSTDYWAVYADGVKNLEREVADMAKTDLRDYTFSDVKVVFPRGGLAVITYKVAQHATSGGQDVSGTYNCGSVWMREGGKWAGLFHTESKAQ